MIAVDTAHPEVAISQKSSLTTGSYKLSTSSSTVLPAILVRRLCYTGATFRAQLSVSLTFSTLTY